MPSFIAGQAYEPEQRAIPVLDCERVVGAIEDDRPDRLRRRVDGEPHGERRFVVIFRLVALGTNLGPAPDVRAEALV